jgi:hypothetical protein
VKHRETQHASLFGLFVPQHLDFFVQQHFFLFLLMQL